MMQLLSVAVGALFVTSTAAPLTLNKARRLAGSLSIEPCATSNANQSANWGSYLLPTSEWAKYLKMDNVSSLAQPYDCGNIICSKTVDLSAAGNDMHKPQRLVIDTDLNNEVDDYPAVAWGLLSSVGELRDVTIESIIAAPFSFNYRFLPLVRAQQLERKAAESNNGLSSNEQQFLGSYTASLQRLKDVGVDPQKMIEQKNHVTWCPAKGMEESYQGLVRFLELFKEAKSRIAPIYADAAETKVFRGETEFVSGTHQDAYKQPRSDGVEDLISRAKTASVEDPLYVLSIAAPTNVAAALLRAPEIVSKIVVLWDAGYGLQERARYATGSLNSGADPVAARVLLESGVRLFFFPGFPVLQSLQMSINDVRAWYKEQGPVSNAIYDRFMNNPDSQFSGMGITRYNRELGTTRIMWDMGPFAPFITPTLVSVREVEPVAMKQVESVGCNGYETLGSSCKALNPNTGAWYHCHELSPHDPTVCADGFFVDMSTDQDVDEVFRRPVLQADSFEGLETGGVATDFLQKLAMAGL